MLVLAFSSLASAQATRTWVSGVGDDANPCSRTAPCKTWAGAISKTAPGGEIDALDPGGFGALTITKSITLDGGGGQVASVLVGGTNGIVIAAGATDVVILHNLRFDGLLGNGTTTASPGLDGVKILSAGTVVLDNLDIFGFNQNGIEVAAGASINVAINNCRIENVGLSGVTATTTSGTAVVAIDNLHNYKCSPCLDGGANSDIRISNSELALGGKGIRQLFAGSTITVLNSRLHGFNNDAIVSIGGSTVNVSGTTITRSAVTSGSAIVPNGGTIASDGTNILVDNTSNGAFNGTITKL